MITLTEAVIASFITYVLMVAAYFLARQRFVHVPVMLACFGFDLAMPFYLFLTRDWVKRLIDNQDILSFGVWTHFGLVITLYVLWFVQLQSAIKLLRGDRAVLSAHHGQAKGILLVRGLVILSGAWLAEPLEVASGQ